MQRSRMTTFTQENNKEPVVGDPLAVVVADPATTITVVIAAEPAAACAWLWLRIIVRGSYGLECEYESSLN